MAVHGGRLALSTRGDADVVDITEGVEAVLRTSERQLGTAVAFVTGSTAALTTIEYEPGAVSDLRALLDVLVPARADWSHNERNHDSNAHAHLRVRVDRPVAEHPVRRWPARAREVAAAGARRLRRPPARARGDRPDPRLSRPPDGVRTGCLYCPLRRSLRADRSPSMGSISALYWPVLYARRHGGSLKRRLREETPPTGGARRSLKTQQHAHLGRDLAIWCASRFDPLATGHRRPQGRWSGCEGSEKETRHRPRTPRVLASHIGHDSST